MIPAWPAALAEIAAAAAEQVEILAWLVVPAALEDVAAVARVVTPAWPAVLALTRVAVAAPVASPASAAATAGSLAVPGLACQGPDARWPVPPVPNSRDVRCCLDARRW